MKKVDKTVLRETKYIAAFVLLFSAFMQAIFLIAGQWDYTVLLGNLLSGAIAVANFFFMGLTVQTAVGKEEKQARNMMKLSQSGRLVLLFVTAALGVALPCFHIVASLVPLFFPRIAILLRPLFLKKEQMKKADISDGKGGGI